MNELLEPIQGKSNASSTHVAEVMSSIPEATFKGNDFNISFEKFSKFLRNKSENSESENLILNISDNIIHTDEYLEKVIAQKGKFYNKQSNFNVLTGSDKVYYKKTQRWQGVITKIDKDFFEAKLTDISNGGTNEIAEFYIDEISPSDIKLVSLGAVFYWSVGYKYTNGQITKESLIRLQRLPRITSDEFDVIADKAKLLNNSIEWS